MRRLLAILASLALILVLVGPASTALVGGTCGFMPSCTDEAAHGGGDVGRLGDVCEDHGHCSDHAERTVGGAVLVAALVLLVPHLAARRARRDERRPSQPSATALFRPPRIV